MRMRRRGRRGEEGSNEGSNDKSLCSVQRGGEQRVAEELEEDGGM